MESMKSLGAMVKQLHAMVGTDDLTGWENEFCESVFDQTGGGTDTAYLSNNQVQTIERIYRKNFSDGE